MSFYKFALLFSFFIISIDVSRLAAGGYMAVDNTGQPYKWAGPITLRFDQGPLGTLSKTQADAFTESAMQAWMAPAIPGSTVQFVRGSDLTEDHGNGSSTNPALDLAPPFDGITPVIYDQNGDITEMLGAGASQSVVGVGVVVLPDDLSPVPISEGMIIMNGRMISGAGTDLPMDQFRGAIIHEFGHLIGLGHAQASVAFIETGYEIGSILPGFSQPRFTPDYTGMPTMFPAVLPDLDSLSIDDIYWAKSLYHNSPTVMGSVSGIIKNIDGSPFNGANVVAYSVDDPTSMVTCVSGYTDAHPTTAPTGTFKIPGLPQGSKWIIDVEPIVGLFMAGSSVGPLDPPVDLPSMPEYVNEASIESDRDKPSITTTFAIPTGTSGLDISGAALQFNDMAQITDTITEIDIGTDEHAGQLLNVKPGYVTIVEGIIDPAEPNPQIYGIADVFELGQYHDFFRVKSPAGLELNQAAIFFDNSILDIQLYDLSETQDSGVITGTASGLGASVLSLYLDSSRVGLDVANRGTFAFGVGFTGPYVGGTKPYNLTNYSLLLMFSVSDRDALALAGTDSGTINPDDAVVRIKGRGFKNSGGAPIVTFEDPTLSVTNVTYIDDRNLDIQITKLAGYHPGLTTLQVVNQAASGGYGGRILQQLVGTPSTVTGWELY